MYVVVVYDETGRDTILPNVNDRDLPARRLSLDTEMEALRAEWQRGRGADWALRPEVRHVRLGVPRRHRPKAARDDIVTSTIPRRTVYAACNLATMSQCRP
jgi:hypothetical protein